MAETQAPTRYPTQPVVPTVMAFFNRRPVVGQRTVASGYRTSAGDYACDVPMLVLRETTEDAWLAYRQSLGMGPVPPDVRARVQGFYEVYVD